MSEVKTGTVKFFNSTKGYGFIKPADGGEDLFVHFSGINSDGYKTLTEDQSVDYEVCEGENGKGPVATNVTPR